MAKQSPLNAGIVFCRIHKTSLFFLFLLTSLFIGFGYILHRHPICWSTSNCTQFSLSQQSLVTLSGIIAAISGWIATSWIALRNAKRQHTMNVLLQSRLSTAYQQRMKDAITIYPATPKLTYVKNLDWEDDTKKDAIEGIKYLLNYFEFITIGIKNGDLDEKTLNQSLSVILNTLVNISDEYIKYAQGKSPEVFKELLWLNDRWQK